MAKLYKYKWQVTFISKIKWLLTYLTNRNISNITTTTMVIYPMKKWTFTQTVHKK
jgi:hypothetical protein